MNAASTPPPRAKLKAVELIPVRATARTVWLFVRVQTDAGITGLGEASDAFGYLNTTREQAVRMADEVRRVFALVEGRSPLEVDWLREQGLARAAGGLVNATAFSAVEQAMWDAAGQLLNQPIYALLGGKRRERLPVYANINRATAPRTPAGFAATAKRAVIDGFRAVKLAPFDGFVQSAHPQPASAARVVDGIASVAAVREAVGSDIEIMVDAHSVFDVPLAIEVAHRLEPYRLLWYEEPVAPERVTETAQIRRSIRQPMAGGETLFRTNGFAPLCASGGVEVIMPDVKHCGGLREFTHIAALADQHRVAVAPHNPSGPVCTAQSAQVGAAVPNFRTLELQWGEVPWRSELVEPPEVFERGDIIVSDRPGCGVKLNERLVQKYRM